MRQVASGTAGEIKWPITPFSSCRGSPDALTAPLCRTQRRRGRQSSGAHRAGPHPRDRASPGHSPLCSGPSGQGPGTNQSRLVFPTALGWPFRFGCPFLQHGKAGVVTARGAVMLLSKASGDGSRTLSGLQPKSQAESLGHTHLPRSSPTGTALRVVIVILPATWRQPRCLTCIHKRERWSLRG